MYVKKYLGIWKKIFMFTYLQSLKMKMSLADNEDRKELKLTNICCLARD